MKKTEKEYINQVKWERVSYVEKQANLSFLRKLIDKIVNYTLVSWAMSLMWLTISAVLVSGFNLQQLEKFRVPIFAFFLCILPIILCLAGSLICSYVISRIKSARKKFAKEFPHYKKYLEKMEE